MNLDEMMPEMLEKLKVIGDCVELLVQEVQEEKKVDREFRLEVTEILRQIQQSLSALDEKISANEKNLQFLEAGYHKTAMDVANLKLVR